MKAYVITLMNNEYSNQVADRCIASAAQFGLGVEKFYGIEKERALSVMTGCELEWTWAKDNTQERYCPVTGLYQFPYTTSDFRAKVGCSMSHYLLWKRCVEFDEPLLILEHDAVFLRPLPEVEFKGICQINDPAGATRKGSWWSGQMKKRGGEGVFEKTWVTAEKERHIPDGLAGNSAYMIKPHAAQELINKFHELGVWPNDAVMCKQLFPYLEEYYPFITKVVQTRSTTT
jgi:GR25 family glycosyltransferase involved in LPS biosynthesis